MEPTFGHERCVACDSDCVVLKNDYATVTWCEGGHIGIIIDHKYELLKEL